MHHLCFIDTPAEEFVAVRVLALVLERPAQLVCLSWPPKVTYGAKEPGRVYRCTAVFLSWPLVSLPFEALVGFSCGLLHIAEVRGFLKKIEIEIEFLLKNYELPRYEANRIRIPQELQNANSPGAMRETQPRVCWPISILLAQ